MFFFLVLTKFVICFKLLATISSLNLFFHSYSIFYQFLTHLKDCRLKDQRKNHLLMHYIDKEDISDRFSLPVKQWHIRHTMSNHVFLVLSIISCGIPSWSSVGLVILVRRFSSKVLALKIVYICVHTSGFIPLQGFAMTHQHQQDKGDEKMQRDRE